MRNNTQTRRAIQLFKQGIAAGDDLYTLYKRVVPEEIQWRAMAKSEPVFVPIELINHIKQVAGRKAKVTRESYNHRMSTHLDWEGVWMCCYDPISEEEFWSIAPNESALSSAENFNDH